MTQKDRLQAPLYLEDEKNATTQSVNILLTGSTGAVGTQLLHALLEPLLEQTVPLDLPAQAPPLPLPNALQLL